MSRIFETESSDNRPEGFYPMPWAHKSGSCHTKNRSRVSVPPGRQEPVIRPLMDQEHWCWYHKRCN